MATGGNVPPNLAGIFKIDRVISIINAAVGSERGGIGLFIDEKRSARRIRITDGAQLGVLGNSRMHIDRRSAIGSHHAI